jgi:hypothetical protein
MTNSSVSTFKGEGQDACYRKRPLAAILDLKNFPEKSEKKCFLKNTKIGKIFLSPGIHGQTCKL